ncbi:MAG: cytidylyltransferase domain-containing protein, partial [Oscillospiraceae bacterium]
MKIIGVIPARYESSRFPGKPLADICGKPMIWWVYNQALKVKRFDAVYVATDDERIESVCKELDINVIMTSDKHKSGTDRAAEVAEKVEGDLFVIVMGDEPLVSPDDIQSLIDKASEGESDVVMLCTTFKNGVDIVNTTTIKLAINDNNELIYMSRQPIPYPKACLDYEYYKNVGAYS